MKLLDVLALSDRDLDILIEAGDIDDIGDISDFEAPPNIHINAHDVVGAVVGAMEKKFNFPFTQIPLTPVPKKRGGDYIFRGTLSFSPAVVESSFIKAIFFEFNITLDCYLVDPKAKKFKPKFHLDDNRWLVQMPREERDRVEEEEDRLKTISHISVSVIPTVMLDSKPMFTTPRQVCTLYYDKTTKQIRYLPRGGQAHSSILLG